MNEEKSGIDELARKIKAKSGECQSIFKDVKHPTDRINFTNETN